MTKLLTLPNLLTLSRIPLALAAVWFYQSPVIYVLLALAFLSDAADGWLARRLKQESAFGAFLDPLCDKLAAVIVFGSLFFILQLPLWYLGAFFFRDICTAIGAVALWSRIPKVQARLSGKAVTLLQFLAICSLFLGMDPYRDYVYAVLAMVAVVSVVDYGVHLIKMKNMV